MAKKQSEAGSTTKLLVEEGKARTHVESPLMMESLIDRGLIDSTRIEFEVGVLPDAHMIHIGGRMVDRGSEFLPAIIDEVVAIRPKHKLVIGVGGGIRERHTFAQCIDRMVLEIRAGLHERTVSHRSTRLFSIGRVSIDPATIGEEM